MIAVLEGWRRLASVGVETYVAPDRAIQIRYRMRVAPLRRVADVVAATLAELPEWRTARASPRTRIVTHEGEYAFGVAFEGHVAGTPARRYIGVIYGDDFYNVVDTVALASVGEHVLDAHTTMLVRGASLRLGMRPRRYLCDRPAGWHGHATGLVTHWFPPLFPARASTIVVYPANPTNEEPQAVLDSMIAHHQAAGATVRELAAPAPIAAAGGLAGVHWSHALAWAGGRTVVRDLVVFARGAFTYTLQLDAVTRAPALRADDEARAVFVALARSVVPIAPPGGLGASDPLTYAAFSHYT